MRCVAENNVNSKKRRKDLLSCSEVAMRKKMKNNEVQRVEELQTCVKRH